jgi:hypothetical protein
MQDAPLSLADGFELLKREAGLSTVLRGNLRRPVRSTWR